MHALSKPDLTLSEKAMLVLKAADDPSQIDAVCDRYNIERDEFDRWCQAFLSGGTERLVTMDKEGSTSRVESHVEATLDYLPSSHFLLRILARLIAVLNQRDSYTKQHSDDVAYYSIEIGKHLGLDSDTMQTLYIAGTLHDVGKIGISDHILNKDDELTSEEMELMKEHPRLAVELIGTEEGLQDVSKAVYHHHENYDGSGYPEGLAGEEIPLLARILAIADAFSAMTTDRPYRPAMRVVDAARELVNKAGTQFDPKLVPIFVERVLKIPLSKLQERS